MDSRNLCCLAMRLLFLFCFAVSVLGQDALKVSSVTGDNTGRPTPGIPYGSNVTVTFTPVDDKVSCSILEGFSNLPPLLLYALID